MPDQFNKDGNGDVYSLESILAEYKGRAFVQGKSKLSKDELEDEAHRIIEEFTAQEEAEKAPPPQPEEEPLSSAAEEEAQPAEREEAPAEGGTAPRRAVKEKQPKAPKKPHHKRQMTATPLRGGAEYGLMSDLIHAIDQSPMEDEAEDIRIYERPKKSERTPHPGESAANESAAPSEAAGLAPSEGEERKTVPSPVPVTAAKELPSEPTPAAAEKKPRKPRRGELVKKTAEKGKEGAAKRGIEKGLREVESKLQRVSQVEEKQARMFSYRELSEDEQEFFGVGKYARGGDEAAEADVRRAREREERRAARAEARRRAAEARSAAQEREEERRRELSGADAVRVYGSGLRSIRLRLFPMLLLCLFMAGLTLLPQAGVALPSPLGDGNIPTVALALALLLCAVCGLEVFSSGLVQPFRGSFGPETLVAASVLFALLDAALQIFTDAPGYGTPFCAAAGFSLLFATWGELKGRKGYQLSFKLLAKTKVPTVVSSEWEKVDEGAVVSKNVGSSRGFVKRSTERDLTERLYAWLAPVLLLLAFLLALLCSFINGERGSFVHCLSAFGAVTAGFDLLLIFNRPFFSAASELYDHGAAIAGWSGAVDMQRAVGMVLRDTDLFPENSVRLSGLKFYSRHPEEKIVAYTGSLMLASGVGTAKVFAELMREYGCELYRVEEFSCYESGGIGANINGSQVLVGSAGFMNLMGIRLPQNLELKSAVFSAIDQELAGVFITGYTPRDTVQAALVNMLHARIRPVFAVRDFNVTPALIAGKFKVTLEEGEFMTFAARYELSQNNPQPAEEPSAIMSREGAGHYVETVRSGRRLYRTARLSLVMTLLGTGLGLLLMLLILSKGAFGSASAGNTLSFLFLWEIATFLFASF